MKNYKVLVNIAKDPGSSHFLGNECILHIYSRGPFHRHHCIRLHSDTWSQARDLTHRKQTVFSVSYNGENWSCSTSMGRCFDRLLLQMRSVTENRQSTGADPANMPRNNAASCCNIGKFLPKTKMNWQNTSLFGSKTWWDKYISPFTVPASGIVWPI